MSEARELLKRALDYLTESPRSGFNKLCSDIEAELAKPEPEPTAYLVKIDRYKDDDCELYYSQRTALIRRLDDLPPIPSNAKHITPLYTSPPQQKPLGHDAMPIKDGRYALYYRDNSMGDGDLLWLIGYRKNEKWFCENNDNPLLEYVGDEIVHAVPLEYPSQGYDSAQLEIDRLRNALSKIANWEFPETGQYWDEDKQRPVSYETEHGSRGVQWYIQNLAIEALNEN